MVQQHGLGRGLASLIPKKTAGEVLPKKDAASRDFSVPKRNVVPQDFTTPKGVVFPTLPHTLPPDDESQRVIEIPLEKIVPNPHQPRSHFHPEKLEELAQSIREHGILQPLIVTEEGDHYELIAGERRLQAAHSAGLQTVPVIVRQAADQEKFELAMIENIQRHDLNPLEEAKAYRRLTEEFGLSQEDVARKMGKSRSTVANTLRLLNLPVEIQRAIVQGKLSEGHAKALLAIENPEKQRALFELIMKNGLTVREAETKARDLFPKTPKRLVSNDPLLVSQAEKLSEFLGTRVRINKVGKGGRIVIEYYGEEDLQHLMEHFA